MSDDNCSCGCATTPDTETKAPEDCTCDCGGTGGKESKEDAVA